MEIWYLALDRAAAAAFSCALARGTSLHLSLAGGRRWLVTKEIVKKSNIPILEKYRIENSSRGI